MIKTLDQRTEQQIIEECKQFVRDVDPQQTVEEVYLNCMEAFDSYGVDAVLLEKPISVSIRSEGESEHRMLRWYSPSQDLYYETVIEACE